MSDIKKYHNVRELAKEMYQCAKAGNYVSAVVFYDVAVSLLHCLMCDYNLNPVSIDLSSSEYCGYDKEYYVSIVEDDNFDIKDIIVEKANLEGTYLSTDVDYIFIDGDASSKIVVHTPLDHYVVFDNEFSSYYEEDECEEDYIDSDIDDELEYLIDEAIEHAEIVRNISNEIEKVNIDIYDILMYLYEELNY